MSNFILSVMFQKCKNFSTVFSGRSGYDSRATRAISSAVFSIPKSELFISMS